MSQLSDRIDALFDQEQWAAARKLLQLELRKRPSDHWLLARLATTYYEEKRYGKALDMAKRARRIAPNCPLVLWELAGSLDATGKTKAAIKEYARLLKLGPDAGEKDECGEGIDWMLSLLTDCMFRLGLCWERLGKRTKALRAYQGYLKMVSLGTKSIYTLNQVQQQIRRLAQGGPDLRHHELASIQKQLAPV